MYSNSYCSSSFESEIIKFGQSSHKMYSYTILNFEESTIILNARTKKSVNLSYAPRIWHQIFLLNTNNFQKRFIWFIDGTLPLLPRQIKLDLVVIAMKEYSRTVASPSVFRGKSYWIDNTPIKRIQTAYSKLL